MNLTPENVGIARTLARLLHLVWWTGLTALLTLAWTGHVSWLTPACVFVLSFVRGMHSSCYDDLKAYEERRRTTMEP